MNQILIEQYKILHQTQKNYGNAATYLKHILEIIKRDKHESILDFGCGKGELARKLCVDLIHASQCVYCYDPAIERFSTLPNGDFDLVIANDVFEHFDPKEVDEELKLINYIARRGIFANISCRSAIHHLPNGTNCHTTLLKPNEWLKLMDRLFVGKTLISKQYNEKNKNLRVYYCVDK